MGKCKKSVQKKLKRQEIENYKTIKTEYERLLKEVASQICANTYEFMHLLGVDSSVTKQCKQWGQGINPNPPRMKRPTLIRLAKEFNIKL